MGILNAMAKGKGDGAPTQLVGTASWPGKRNWDLGKGRAGPTPTPTPAAADGEGEGCAMRRMDFLTALSRRKVQMSVRNL